MKLVPRTALVAASVAWFAVAAPQSAAANNAAAAAAIRAGSAAFVKEYNAGNADAVVAHFEEGAIAMPPGMPPVRGRAEIRQFVERGIAGAKANGITLALGRGDDVGISGDLAWHSGPYSVTNQSGTTIDTGKFLETWHTTGGKWRIVRRIWNSNPPAPAGPPVPAPAPAPK